MAPVSIVVVGAGQRGAGYARWVRRHPDRASVVAVAEPRQVPRARLAAEHGITAGNVAADWRELAGRGRLADAVLICTQDRMHAEPAEAFAALGYHILLEKPGRAPLRVSSFGRPTYFTAANRPPGAADRCVACPVEASCPYSAPRLYRGLLEAGEHRWPPSVVIDDFTPAALDEALASGPYGQPLVPLLGVLAPQRVGVHGGHHMVPSCHGIRH